MNPIRWTEHAIRNLNDREIDRLEADRTLASPDAVVSAPHGRRVFMRRYHDIGVGQDMLLRIVMEEVKDEWVVVTLYKTSQLSRYLGGD